MKPFPKGFLAMLSSLKCGHRGNVMPKACAPSAEIPLSSSSSVCRSMPHPLSKAAAKAYAPPSPMRQFHKPSSSTCGSSASCIPSDITRMLPSPSSLPGNCNTFGFAYRKFCRNLAMSSATVRVTCSSFGGGFSLGRSTSSSSALTTSYVLLGSDLSMLKFGTALSIIMMRSMKRSPFAIAFFKPVLAHAIMAPGALMMKSMQNVAPFLTAMSAPSVKLSALFAVFTRTSDSTASVPSRNCNSAAFSGISAIAANFSCTAALISPMITSALAPPSAWTASMLKFMNHSLSLTVAKATFILAKRWMTWPDHLLMKTRLPQIGSRASRQSRTFMLPCSSSPSCASKAGNS
mmetsp:Transcript_39025/g.87435  ORF Transcript_39025/g.87435 Transcript_39025/m.87435 type:complete len:348 (-) Transcript_39025:10-1053(-)